MVISIEVQNFPTSSKHAVVFQVSVHLLCMADGVNLETGASAVYRAEAE